MDLAKRAERWLKWHLFGFLRHRRRDGGSVDLRRVRRVLVVRANFRMGNLLLVTPALAALRRALPRACIDVIGPRNYVELLEHSPDVDRRIGIDRATLLAPWSFARLVRDLRRQGYDLALDGARGSSFLGALLVGLSGSRWRVASAGSRYEALFDVHVPADPAVWHKVDLLLGLLNGLGIATATRTPSITLTAPERERAVCRWLAIGIAPGTTRIAVNVGARGTKRWPNARVVELIGALRAAYDVPLVLLAGPEDERRLAEMRPYLPAGVTVAPRMRLRTFAAFLAQCTVLVTQDTGPMHLAVAAGVPTVALLNSPRSTFFAPRGPEDRTVFAGGESHLPAVLEAVRAALESASPRLTAGAENARAGQSLRPMNFAASL